ncbi:hypothetical protein [Microcoleus sp.]
MGIGQTGHWALAKQGIGQTGHWACDVNSQQLTVNCQQSTVN